MKQVILYIACSLDGFIARPDGSIDFLKKYEGKNEDYGYHEFMKKVDCVIMGSKTYEQCLEFEGWPENKKLKTIVLTKRNLRKVLGANISFYSGLLDELMKEVKRESKKNVWLVGGAEVVQSFLKEGLIDEMIISIIPVHLGEGISLFGNAGEEVELELIKNKVYKDGIVQLQYEVKKKRGLIKETKQIKSKVIKPIKKKKIVVKKGKKKR